MEGIAQLAVFNTQEILLIVCSSLLLVGLVWSIPVNNKVVK